MPLVALASASASTNARSPRPSAAQRQLGRRGRPRCPGRGCLFDRADELQAALGELTREAISVDGTRGRWGGAAAHAAMRVTRVPVGNWPVQRTFRLRQAGRTPNARAGSGAPRRADDTSDPRRDTSVPRRRASDGALFRACGFIDMPRWRRQPLRRRGRPANLVIVRGDRMAHAADRRREGPRRERLAHHARRFDVG